MCGGTGGTGVRAAILNSRGGIRIGDVPAPQAARSGLVMRVTAVGICGSDLVKFGHTPDGAILGHEISGVVESTGSAVKQFKRGDRIMSAHHIPCGRCRYCRRGNESQCALFRSTDLDPGGWAEYVGLSARHLKHVTLRLPADMPDDIASLIEPLGCCVRAVRRADVRRNDTVAVIGLGPVGLMITALLRRKGISVYVADKIRKRTGLAVKWTGAKTLPPSPDRACAEVLRSTADRGADQIILCAGAPATIPLALRMVRRGGKIHLFSGIQMGGTVDLDINSIYKREVSLFSTYSSTPADLAEAFRLIRRGKIPAADMITHRLPLSRIREGIESIRKGEALKVILDPSG